MKLEPRYENAGEVMANLVALNPDPQAFRAELQAAGIKTFGSLEKLITAYSTLYRTLQGTYDTPQKLKKYWGFLANNVVFIRISTDVSSALKIFETINERGIGLDSMDLLKNLLFTQVRQDEFIKLKDEWKRITAPLEEAKEKPLRFLRYFLMANYVIRNARGDAVVREDESIAGSSVRITRFSAITRTNRSSSSAKSSRTSNTTWPSRRVKAMTAKTLRRWAVSRA